MVNGVYFAGMESLESRAPRLRDEPTKVELTNYFRRFGLRLRTELKALADPEFAVFGTRQGPDGAPINAKQENWFIGYRAMLETAMSLKIAELLRLPDEERELLLEASMTHHATKRVQYAHPDEIDSIQYEKIQMSGRDTLINAGIDPRAIEIGRAVGPHFKEQLAGGKLIPENEEERTLLKLQRYLAYVENCVEQRFDRTSHTQKVDITNWLDRINASRERYPNISSQEFDIELHVTGDIEHELTEEIRGTNPDIGMQQDEPLWSFLRKQIMTDVVNGKLPEVPSV